MGPSTQARSPRDWILHGKRPGRVTTFIRTESPYATRDARKVLRAARETANHTHGRSAPVSVLCRFARRAQAFRRGAARRNDLRPGESHYVAGLVSVRHFPVFREPRWRRKVHVMTYVLGVYL